MRKLLIILLYVATAAISQAQVSKIVGEWNTFDDKTGAMRCVIRIYEEHGEYLGVVTTLYEKDGEGNYHVMRAPYPKAYQGYVGTNVFSGMKADGDQLKGKIFDPERQKTYHAKVSYNAATDELVLRGSLDRFGVLGRSQTWKRKE